MSVFRQSICLAAAVFLLCAFKVSEQNPALGQPMDERQAQDALPKSKDAMWKLLAKTRVKLDDKKGMYSATYPDEIKALVGKPFTISGFVMPLDATEKFSHFILSKRTPTCSYCPPGEPNEIIDVWLEKPMKYDENLVKITGTFELINNQEMGMFFKLAKAKKE